MSTVLFGGTLALLLLGILFTLQDIRDCLRWQVNYIRDPKRAMEHEP